MGNEKGFGQWRREEAWNAWFIGCLTIQYKGRAGAGKSGNRALMTRRDYGKRGRASPRPLTVSVAQKMGWQLFLSLFLSHHSQIPWVTSLVVLEVLAGGQPLFCGVNVLCDQMTILRWIFSAQLKYSNCAQSVFLRLFPEVLRGGHRSFWVLYLQSASTTSVLFLFGIFSWNVFEK